MRRAYATSTVVMAVVMIVIGIAAIVRTAAAAPAGLAVGYLIGAGLVTAGGLRLWLARRVR